MMSESFDKSSTVLQFSEPCVDDDSDLTNNGISHMPSASEQYPRNSIPRSFTDSAAAGSVRSFGSDPAGISPPGSTGTGSYAFCSGSRAPAVNLSNIDTQAAIESLKHWSVTTYKCTKQAINERFGKTQRTVDTEVEQKIDALRSLKQQYESLLKLNRAAASHFFHLLQTQKQLAEACAELARQEPELAEEFKRNAELNTTVVKNGENLLSALNLFINTINTLCQKTIEDTLLTAKQYDSARLEYDAYRNDLDEFQRGSSRTGSDWTARLHEMQTKADSHRRRFEQLRDDVQVKIKFLNENKVKVMKKQLVLLHNATANYFAGNQKGLEAALKQFSVRPIELGNSQLSWLEQ